MISAVAGIFSRPRRRRGGMEWIMRYEWFVAKRYLRPRGGVTFIFHLTLFSIAGVALGVASLVTVLSVMNGFGNDIRGKIMRGRSHLVLNYPDGLSDYRQYLPEFSRLGNVEACAPAIIDGGMLYPADFENPPSVQVLITGVDPQYEPGVTGLDEKLIVGSMDGLGDGPAPAESGGRVRITDLQSTRAPGIFIGKELAARLFQVFETGGEDKRQAYLRVLGERVTLVTLPSNEVSISLAKPNMRIFRVAGVFETGHFDFDYSWVFVSLSSAQYLTDLKDEVTQIRFKLNDYSEHATTASMREVYELNNQLVGFGYPRTWMDMDSTFFEALKIEKATMNYILKIIILVATFNIIATLFMIVMAKTRDIGLLRAIGASRRGVLRIFLMVGVYIGLIGTLAGVAFGFAICSFIQIFPPELPGGGQVYNLRYLPCDMEWLDFVGVSIYTFCISFLASLYPAVRAARLTPVDAIRYS